MISEVIVVEGRDDEAAVKQACEAEIITTHGFGISRETFERIERAYRNRGIIILTDPDFAGEKIRKRLSERFPDAKHAHISREEASKDGDVGVENASPQNIRDALAKVRTIMQEDRLEFTRDDMLNYGLTGDWGAAERRQELGRLLGIGYGNAKVFLARLNHYGVTRKEFLQAWINYTHREQSGE